ncbi:Hypp8275 [Branchiostoma lanceolatum]|uniref:Hypp8275 protein n=1 Tax=Branchiostoma lanceolatum TaxID=7740 RepID=A0A8K0EF56_BRALA|nr:Hypp8275 [Branchiostoma lanceolatum]
MEEPQDLSEQPGPSQDPQSVMGPPAQPVPSTSTATLPVTYEVSTQEERASSSSSSISEVPSAEVTFESQSSSTTSEGEADTSIWVDEKHHQEVNRESLNTAIDRITEGGVSPIRSSLNTPWEEVTDRQKNYYLKKAREAVQTTMTVIAPGQEQDLWRGLVKAPPFYHEEQPPMKKKMWDQQTVQTLVKAYQEAETWQTRQQILSLFADDYTKDELQELIPGLTKWRIDQARAHATESGPGKPVQQQPIYRTRLNPVKTDHFLSFLTQPHLLQDVAYGTKTMKLDSGETITIPAAIRTLIPSRIINQYQQHCAGANFQPLHDRTLFKIIEVCAASRQKSLQGLDYISTEGTEAFDALCTIVDALVQSGASVAWGKTVTPKLKEGKRYLKTDYKTHVNLEDKCGDHCISFALSEKGKETLAVKCSHCHEIACDRCTDIDNSLSEVQKMIEKEGLLSEEHKSRLLFSFEQSSTAIQNWKAHLLRAVNQDLAKQSALQQLDKHTALIVMDWAMKFLPLKYREQMTDFFGKRGRSWHVSAVITKGDDGKFDVECFVHIFNSCRQDWSAICAILQSVLQTIKSENPALKKAFLRSDNAGCYHCAPLMLSLPSISQKTGISVLRYDFSDPQAGKDICDRKIASMKTHIRRYVNEKHDVLTAESMKEALESHGGIKGCRIAVAQTEETNREYPRQKWEGVKSWNNFMFETDEDIRVWRAFDIGVGEVVSFPPVPQTQDLPTLKITAPFGPPQSHTSHITTSSGGDKSPLFHCPEPGCVATFHLTNKLEEHMDVGEHLKELERESAYDKIRKQWAQAVTGIAHGPGLASQSLGETSRVDAVGSSRVVSEGWAIRTAKGGQRMSDKTKTYLTDIFNQGATSGQKADAAQVALDMQHAKGSDGKLLLQPSEWRTAKQITSYFARLSAAQRQESTESVDTDMEAIEKEGEWQALRNTVYSNIDYSHPVMFEDINLCELTKTKGLKSLKLQQLKRISDHFHLHITGSMARKTSFTQELESIIGTCSCGH